MGIRSTVLDDHVYGRKPKSSSRFTCQDSEQQNPSLTEYLSPCCFRMAGVDCFKMDNNLPQVLYN